MNGRPINSDHPGFDNLNPEMQKRLLDNLKKEERGRDLSPEESKDQDKLVEIVMTGDPID